MQVDPLLLYTLSRDTLFGAYHLFAGSPAEEACPPCVCQCVNSGEASGECPALERLVAHQLQSQTSNTNKYEINFVLHAGFLAVAFVIGALVGRGCSCRRGPRSLSLNDGAVSGSGRPGKGSGTGGGVIVVGAGPQGAGAL